MATRSMSAAFTFANPTFALGPMSSAVFSPDNAALSLLFSGFEARALGTGPARAMARSVLVFTVVGNGSPATLACQVRGGGGAYSGGSYTVSVLRNGKVMASTKQDEDGEFMLEWLETVERAGIHSYCIVARAAAAKAGSEVLVVVDSFDAGLSEELKGPGSI